MCARRNDAIRENDTTSKSRRKFLSYSAALARMRWLAGCNGDTDPASGAAGSATVAPTVPTFALC
ncbi:hypothetical protein LGN17_20805 [Burkholderia sp. AU30280]|uniref:hypothetical protein n=1 Tax=Burkholderia sp. AU30280 TaxID=2879628 RepID=UPI001CF3E79F|nr:hypothetical protein [Burkholderia sp. AU30280]MCA8274929.1 hypothetical protein [Burkholderia sp. AU30280]